MSKSLSEAGKIARHMAEFLDVYAPNYKTKSEHTLKSYRDTLTIFIGFLESEKHITPTTLCGGCFSRLIMEEWLAWMRDSRGCCPDTCNVRLGGLREFLKYIGSRDPSFMYLYLEAKEIPKVPTVKKKVSGLSRDAVRALVASPDLLTKTGKRDITVIVLMYNTAIRLDELLSLKVKNIQLGKNPGITVIGKGSKVRTLPILPRTVAYLKKYLQEFHGNAPDPDAYVFYSRNVGPYGKLSQPAISKMLKKYAQQANTVCPDVPLTLHAHQIRHARATHWLEDGINIVQISHLLGHAQVETTMVYLDVSLEQTADALAALENDEDRTIMPKWKSSDNGLAAFCGCRSLQN